MTVMLRDAEDLATGAGRLSIGVDFDSRSGGVGRLDYRHRFTENLFAGATAQIDTGLDWTASAAIGLTW